MSPRIAVIPGDGIGPEVTAEAVRVLQAVLPGVTTETYDLGAERYLRTGELLPAALLAELDSADALLLGAIGAPQVPPGVLERGVLLALRFALDHHVNLRPARLTPGVPTPLRPGPDGTVPLDLVVVREGTEGPYTGNGGVLRAGTPHAVATEVSVNTAYGIHRVVRDAFARAQRRRGRLTLVHKTNVLGHAGGLWTAAVADLAPQFPDVTTDYCHVDAAAMYLVTDPGRFDVLVTDNLFGDILTDLAAALAGGIGLAASGNLDVSRAHPSMFEPVHGSAPDIAGQQKADPTAAVLSVAMLLDHLGEPAAAAAVDRAVSDDLAARVGRPPRSTREVGEALAAAAADRLADADRPAAP